MIRGYDLELQFIAMIYRWLASRSQATNLVQIKSGILQILG